MRRELNGWRPGLVALDVDGTLIDAAERMSVATRSAVRRALAAGAAVVVATGRSLHSTRWVVADLGLTGPTVSSNGAVTWHAATGDVAEVVTFDARPALRTLTPLVPDALLAAEELGVGYRVTGEFPAGELDGRISVVSHDDLVSAPVTRLIVRWVAGSSEEMIDVVERAGLHGVSYAVGYTAWLDVMPEGVTKASALEGLRRRLGVPAAATLAIGDGRNDVEMLEWAAHGVAMGDAPEDVRAVADEVTGTVGEDGVAEVLSRFFG